MRSLLSALLGITLAAGVTYAHSNASLGNLADAPGQAAGTLACTTRPGVSLVFGRTAVADCTYLAERGGFRQDYVAMLSGLAAAGDVDAARRIVWRVSTRDGFSRPGMLAGSFTAPAGAATAAARPALPEFEGRLARLRLVSHSGQSGAAFALRHPGLALAAVQPGLGR